MKFFNIGLILLMITVDAFAFRFSNGPLPSKSASNMKQNPIENCSMNMEQTKITCHLPEKKVFHVKEEGMKSEDRLKPYWKQPGYLKNPIGKPSKGTGVQPQGQLKS